MTSVTGIENQAEGQGVSLASLRKHYDSLRGEIHDAWVSGDEKRLDGTLTMLQDQISMAPLTPEYTCPNIWATLYEYAVAAMEIMAEDPSKGPKYGLNVSWVAPHNSRVSLMEQIEQKKAATEVDDQRRIAAGETLPWLGRRETWLNP